MRALYLFNDCDCNGFDISDLLPHCLAPRIACLQNKGDGQKILLGILMEIVYLLCTLLMVVMHRYLF